jgi:hypothetical protein
LSKAARTQVDRGAIPGSDADRRRARHHRARQRHSPRARSLALGRLRPLPHGNRPATEGRAM